MADETFLIAAYATGSDPEAWTAVADLLLDSSDITMRAFQFDYQPFSRYDKLANGEMKGRGFPVTHWTFRALRPKQRENLRDFCENISSHVFIRTRTNETTSGAPEWKDFDCIMNWVQRAEVLGLNAVEMIEMTFTRCIEL